MISQLDRALSREGPNINAPREDGVASAKSSTMTLNAPRCPLALLTFPFATGKSVVPGVVMDTGGSMSTVTSRWSLSRLPASTAISPRPQIRMTPPLSSITNGTDGMGSAAIASNAASFGRDRTASLDHPDPVESVIALTVTCSRSLPFRAFAKLADAAGKVYTHCTEGWRPEPVKLLRTIQLDASDSFVFEKPAEAGEWAVSGAFAFVRSDPANLQGKARTAFRAGFLGLPSLGRSTLAQIVEAKEADRLSVVEMLAVQLV